MEKYIDLNGRDKSVTANIKICEKTFKIKRVVIAVRTLYSNHLIEMGNLFKRVGKLNENNKETLDSLNEAIDSYNEKKEKLYDRILILLLEKNGYSYDKKWWDENTEETTIRMFIEECLNKGTSGETKKKVLK